VLNNRKQLENAFKNAAARNVFVMMRYRDDPRFRELEALIRESLAEYGLIARFAKDVAYQEEVWANIVFYMSNCSLGLAVFEEMDEREFNPNISMELGYMLALGVRCLILKDKRMPRLPTDVCGRIYSDFDTYDLLKSVKPRIAQWCENDLGLERLNSDESADTEKRERDNNLRLNPFIGWISTVWHVKFADVVSAIEGADNLYDLARRLEVKSQFEGGELFKQIRHAHAQRTSTLNDARALLGRPPLDL
jgi:nucleoside 2-deoxyribosyltransferase